MFTAGNGIYERCSSCGKLVKINKWLFGSLHVCDEDSVLYESKHVKETPKHMSYEDYIKANGGCK